MNRSVASWDQTLAGDGFRLFAPQVRNGFVIRPNCFVAGALGFDPKPSGNPTHNGVGYLTRLQGSAAEGATQHLR